MVAVTAAAVPCRGVPGEAYRRTLAAGLAEGFPELRPEQIDRYLSRAASPPA